MNSEIAARLKSAQITWFATEKGYAMFTRGDCAAVGYERAAGVSLGSSGLMTEAGFACLVWREQRPFLVAHGGAEQLASAAQVEAIRRFSADLKAALAP